MYKYLALVVAILGVLFFIYKEGENKGIFKEVKKQQEIEIKIKDEIIEEKKQITIRKNNNISIDTASNLDWLRKNRCKDCKSR